jgi:ribosomal protein S18 acetylase RimI-like enzyme
MPVDQLLRLTLRDGSAVVVRPLERSDRAVFLDTVSRLSDRSRYLRFAAPKPGLSKREVDALVDIDHHAREALMAFDPTTGRGVAVVRYAALPEEPGAVDVAVTVIDAWQGRGLGSALLTELIARARRNGYATLRATVLADNAASIGMLRRAGFRRVAIDGALWDYARGLDA